MCGAILTARQVTDFRGTELILHHCSRNWVVEQLIHPKMLGWRIFTVAEFVNVENAEHRRITRERFAGWAGAVCRLERFIAYYLSVGRTKSWPVDRLLHSKRFEWIYIRMQKLILFGTWSA